MVKHVYELCERLEPAPKSETNANKGDVHGAMNTVKLKMNEILDIFIRNINNCQDDKVDHEKASIKPDTAEIKEKLDKMANHYLEKLPDMSPGGKVGLLLNDWLASECRCEQLNKALSKSKALTQKLANENNSAIERIKELEKAKAESDERIKELEKTKAEADERINEYLIMKDNYIFTRKGREKGTFKLSEEERKEIYEFHAQGLSNRKIAIMYGVSDKTISNYIKYEC